MKSRRQRKSEINKKVPIIEPLFTKTKERERERKVNIWRTQKETKEPFSKRRRNSLMRTTTYIIVLDKV